VSDSEGRKLRVGVLCGGRSSEHSISCLSGFSLLAAIDREKFEPIPLGITEGGKWVYLEGLTDRFTILSGQLPVVPADAPALTLNSEGILAYGRNLDIDLIFPVLHGPYGEDGTIQGLLEMFDIPYVGAGVLASAIGMDKATYKRLCMEAGIPSVDFDVLLWNEWQRYKSEITARLQEQFTLPVFVKPSRAGSSNGISKVKSWSELDAAISLAKDFDEKILVEAFAPGRELECGILGDRVSRVGEIRVSGNHEFYDFEAKYLDDSTELIVPAKIPAEVEREIQQLALDAFALIDGKGIARVDFFLTDQGKIILNELNTMPGFTATSMYPRLWDATGVNYREVITRLIGMSATTRRLDR
jgi:D-alanine-D-alanine ligase